MRLLHAGHDHGGGRPAARTTRSRPSARSAKGISGNFCRCTGYQHIVNAIQHAAEQEVSHGRRLPSCRSSWASASSAARIRASSRAAAPTSTTSRSSACSTWRSSAATSRTAASARSTRAPRRRWTASKRCSPARRSPSSWRRCRSARRSRRPTIARSPSTRSATAASRWRSSSRAIATSRATPPTRSSSTYDTLPAVVDLELAMTGQPTVIHPDFPNNLAVALVPSGTGVSADRRRRRLGDRRGVRQGRGRHLAADGEPAARAERDGAARRRRALRAGQGAR